MTKVRFAPGGELTTLAGTEAVPLSENQFAIISRWAAYILSALGDTDGTLAANSDAKFATQKAVKTFVAAAVTGLLDFKGSTDCSGNPNYPSALKGDAYIVSVAGKIGGASGLSVDIGDVYFALADNAGGTQGSVGSSWDVLEHNLVGALLSANNLSDLTNFVTARSNFGIESAQVDVASGTTTNIGAASSMNVRITGTTTITAFDTVASGIWRVGYFSGILTLTHNATSLILPGGANITTAAGDAFIARSLGSGNWRVLFYQSGLGGGGGSGVAEDLTTAETDTSKVLSPDGVGGVEWVTGGGGSLVLNVNTTPVGNVGAGEDNLIVYTVPANTLGTNGQYIRFIMSGTFASSINNKRIRVKLGSTTLFDTGALAITSAGDWSLEGHIIRTGSATQRCQVEFESNETALLGSADYVDATEDLTTNLDLKATGEATSDNDVVQKFLIVEKGGGSFSSLVDDTAYDATSWNGDTTHAPSKNAVRNKFNSMDNWLIDITPYTGSHGNTNFSSLNLDTGEVFGGDIESSGAQNDEIYWYVDVSAGTWDFALLHFQGANRGVYSIQVDGVQAGTVDGYNGSPTKNVLSTVTSISIAGGKRKIALKMTAKNGSSSSYFGTFQHLQMRRTA